MTSAASVTPAGQLVEGRVLAEQDRQHALELGDGRGRRDVKWRPGNREFGRVELVDERGRGRRAIVDFMGVVGRVGDVDAAIRPGCHLQALTGVPLPRLRARSKRLFRLP